MNIMQRFFLFFCKQLLNIKFHISANKFNSWSALIIQYMYWTLNWSQQQQQQRRRELPFRTRVFYNHLAIEHAIYVRCCNTPHTPPYVLHNKTFFRRRPSQTLLIHSKRMFRKKKKTKRKLLLNSSWVAVAASSRARITYYRIISILYLFMYSVQAIV